MDTIESLTQKLLATYGTQYQLERLRQRAVPRVVRMLEATCETLPLSMIPITLAWTALVFFLPLGEPLKIIRLYAVGLLAMLIGAAFLFTMQALCSRLKLKDEILSEMTLLSGLAYHPNTALRRCVLARGYATLGEFRAWYVKQREILDTRAADFAAAIDTARRGGATPKNLDHYPPGARAFLEA